MDTVKTLPHAGQQALSPPPRFILRANPFFSRSPTKRIQVYPQIDGLPTLGGNEGNHLRGTVFTIQKYSLSTYG